jgi:integrase
MFCGMASPISKALKTYESPKGSGIKISPISNKTKGEDYNYSFRVAVPRKLTGKSRHLVQFKTKQEAEAFAKDSYSRFRKLGESGFELTAGELVAAKRAFKKLRVHKITLDEAIDYAIPRMRPTGGKKTFSEVVDEMVSLKKNHNLRKESLRDFRNRSQRLKDSFGDMPISDLRAQVLTAWLNSLKLSRRSTENFFNTLNHIMRYAIGEKYIHENPLEGLSRIKKNMLFGIKVEKIPETYAVNEVKTIMEAALQAAFIPILPAFTLGFFCGLRTTELLQLNWTDVHLNDDEPYVQVPADIAKKRRNRAVLIPPNAQKWLSLCKSEDGRIWPKASTPFNNLRVKLLAAAKVESKQNGMRHSFASYHLDKFKDSIETARQLGHKPNDEVLFSNYRALVSNGDGDRFFSIAPPRSNSKLVGFAS